MRSTTIVLVCVPGEKHRLALATYESTGIRSLRYWHHTTRKIDRPQDATLLAEEFLFPVPNEHPHWCAFAAAASKEWLARRESNGVSVPVVVKSVPDKKNS